MDDVLRRGCCQAPVVALALRVPKDQQHFVDEILAALPLPGPYELWPAAGAWLGWGDHPTRKARSPTAGRQGVSHWF